MILNLIPIYINIDIKNLILILLVPFYFSLGLIIYIKNRKNISNKLFFITLLSVVFWTVSMIFYRGAFDVSSTLIWSRLLYASASFIPLIFLYFSISLKYHIYLKDQIPSIIKNKLFHLFLVVPFLLIFYISIFPNFLIENVIIIPGQEKIIIFNKTLHFIYALYIISYFLIAFLIIFDIFKKTTGLTKTQLFYLFIGTLISAIIGIGSNLILPLLGIFTFNWLGQIGVITLVILISYSILKYQLFDIKIILTEVLVLSLLILLIGRILALSPYNTNDLILNFVSFIFTSIFSYFLVKSVRKEVEQKEKFEQLNRIKSEFLSFASHQVKAPMAVVKGYAELIAKNIDNVPEQAKDFAKKIEESVNNLLVLIEEFMDYRRIEEGKLELHFEEVEIISLIKEIVNNLNLLAKQKNLELSFETNLEQMIIKVDKVRFSQVIQNLIDNAIKYTPQGWVKVKVYSKDHKELIIEVSDSGIGMSKELQSKLFGEFVRDPSIKKEIIGTGLGLYIAKNIVEAHKGTIWAESEGEGKGSKFYIKLPLDYDKS